jgi:hypothetical protein
MQLHMQMLSSSGAKCRCKHIGSIHSSDMVATHPADEDSSRRPWKNGEEAACAIVSTRNLWPDHFLNPMGNGP